MATCLRCPAELTGRTKVCDDCKAKADAKRRKPRAKIATPAKKKTGPSPRPRRPKSGVPEGLGPRGRGLWTSLGQKTGTPSGEIALEACRMADRLNELDSIIAGKGVLDLMRFRLQPDWWDEDSDHHVHVQVSFQNVLGEARQQAATFKQLLAELGVTAVPASPQPGSGEESPLARVLSLVGAQHQGRPS